MDIDLFFTLNMLILATIIGIIISFGRKLSEHYHPFLIDNKLWRDLILPYAPCLIGFCYGVFTNDIFVSVIAGFISSHVYRTIKLRFEHKKDE
jgi:hypothetical protein